MSSVRYILGLRHAAGPGVASEADPITSANNGDGTLSIKTYPT